MVRNSATTNSAIFLAGAAALAEALLAAATASAPTATWNSGDPARPSLLSGSNSRLGDDDSRAAATAAAAAATAATATTATTRTRTRTTPPTPSTPTAFRGQLGCRQCDWAGGNELLSHTITPGSAYGVLKHFWIVGDEAVGNDVVVEYYIDDELFPSVSYEVAMASGQGFAQSAPISTNSSSLPSFEVPGKMGHLVLAGNHSWFNAHQAPFLKNIVVRVRTVNPELRFEVGAEGLEVASDDANAAGIAFHSGFVLPRQAKLSLQGIEDATYDPLAFATVAEVPPGWVGLLYMTTTAIDTSPSQNDYIEGCWHLYTDSEQSFPGVVVGTGVEDYFDSAYWFCALNGQAPCLFAHATSGLLHFSRTWANGSAISPEAQRKWRPQPPGSHERLSAYRFFDNEVVGFENGGSLQWRVGETEDKCSGTSGKPLGHSSSVKLRSYAWLYTWRLDEDEIETVV